MATPDDWGIGYARQARADFDAWDQLQGSKLPECQKLHFLQMACEKLAKAHLCKAGSSPQDLQASHAYIAKNLPLILREQLVMEKAGPGVVRSVFHFTRRLAREIELLAPTVNDGGKRPDNCEYPWEDAKGKLWIPSDYKFFTSQLLFEPHGRTVLKLIRAAVLRLLA